MPAHETLRIRTPPPDNDDEPDKRKETKCQHIPTTIFAVALVNFVIYLYNSNELNLSMSGICGAIWLTQLFIAIADKSAAARMRYADAEMESGV